VHVSPTRRWSTTRGGCCGGSSRQRQVAQADPGTATGERGRGVLRQNRIGPIPRHLVRRCSRPRYGILGSGPPRTPAQDAPSEAQRHHPPAQDVLRSAVHRDHADLVLENIALRQPLAAYKSQGVRPRVSDSDRLFWIALRRWWPRWREALVLHPREHLHASGLA
jgi:hypothetical protein